MTLSRFKYNLFFDESKSRDETLDLDLTLMGSLLIPDSLYNSTEIQEVNTRLKNRTIKIHFKEYQNYRNRQFNTYTSVLKKVLGDNGEKSKYYKFNVVAFSDNEYVNNHVAYTPSVLSSMVYSKIPERVIYGSLRNISKYKPTEAKLYIEESTEYRVKELHKLIKEQLNVQALYRNDAFKVGKSGLYRKNKEIGIEITDLLLGIISLIIRNPPLYKPNGQLTSNILKEKKKFIYANKNILEPMLNNVNYFEINGVDRLTKREFSVFFHEFILSYEQEKK
ncbi:hypothetical protein [Enterococcus faecium]|uniref:hypothetical protein n=1 Tax=Enterococcus faecium TaxID=1352 RepID=UPI00338FE5AB